MNDQPRIAGELPTQRLIRWIERVETVLCTVSVVSFTLPKSVVGTLAGAGGAMGLAVRHTQTQPAFLSGDRRLHCRTNAERTLTLAEAYDLCFTTRKTAELPNEKPSKPWRSTSHTYVKPTPGSKLAGPAKR